MKKRKDGIVQAGGVAKEDAEFGDVTRDTYGFSERPSARRTPEERISEADRAAGALGVPGVTMPEGAPPERTERAREESARRPPGVEEAARENAERWPPGVEEAAREDKEEKKAEFVRAEIAGDRTASPRDVSKLQTPNREQARGGDTIARRDDSSSRKAGRARRSRRSSE